MRKAWWLGALCVMGVASVARADPPRVILPTRDPERPGCVLERVDSPRILAAPSSATFWELAIYRAQLVESLRRWREQLDMFQPPMMHLLLPAIDL